MKLNTKIIINTAFVAFHNWETCNIPEVAFLKNYHRHIFNVQATISVSGDDRELEFFTVKKELNGYLKDIYEGKYLPNKSCEMIAEQILFYINRVIASGSKISVRVMEDGENGAEVSNFDGGCSCPSIL